MKRPWLSLTVFSAVFFGIIIFCVIFGGYSSLYRAQNRAGAAKISITAECQKQLDLLPDLVAMARKAGSFKEEDPVNLEQINHAVSETKAILNRFNSNETPLKEELILAFEQSQVQLSKKIIALINEIKKDNKLQLSSNFKDLEKKFNELEITVFYNSNRYNKEARYFNTRKTIFPGFLVAKLFGLEDTHIYEITTDLLTPKKLRS